MMDESKGKQQLITIGVDIRRVQAFITVLSSFQRCVSASLLTSRTVEVEPPGYISCTSSLRTGPLSFHDVLSNYILHFDALGQWLNGIRSAVETLFNDQYGAKLGGMVKADAPEMLRFSLDWEMGSLGAFGDIPQGCLLEVGDRFLSVYGEQNSAHIAAFEVTAVEPLRCKALGVLASGDWGLDRVIQGFKNLVEELLTPAVYRELVGSAIMDHTNRHFGYYAEFFDGVAHPSAVRLVELGTRLDLRPAVRAYNVKHPNLEIRLSQFLLRGMLELSSWHAVSFFAPCLEGIELELRRAIRAVPNVKQVLISGPLTNSAWFREHFIREFHLVNGVRVVMLQRAEFTMVADFSAVVLLGVGREYHAKAALRAALLLEPGRVTHRLAPCTYGVAVRRQGQGQDDSFHVLVQQGQEVGSGEEDQVKVTVQPDYDDPAALCWRLYCVTGSAVPATVAGARLIGVVPALCPRPARTSGTLTAVFSFGGTEIAVSQRTGEGVCYQSWVEAADAVGPDACMQQLELVS